MTVENAREFVDAIGSNLIIQLEEGEYDLSRDLCSDETILNPHVEFGKECDLIIRDVENLSIVGSGSKKSLLIATYSLDVLTFKFSTGISLENLELGHVMEKSIGCYRGVLTFWNSKNVRLREVTLFGSGTFGLDLHTVDGIEVQDSVIRDCSHSVLIFDVVTGAKFELTKIESNEVFDSLLRLKNSRELEFRKCEIVGNRENQTKGAQSASPSFLFEISGNSSVSIRDSIIASNRFECLCGKGDILEFERVSFANNSFDTALEGDPTCCQ